MMMMMMMMRMIMMMMMTTTTTTMVKMLVADDLPETSEVGNRILFGAQHVQHAAADDFERDLATCDV